jgi:hypothetical protein
MADPGPDKLAAGLAVSGRPPALPAATVRLWTQRLPVWQLGSVALAAAQGSAGLWLSVELKAVAVHLLAARVHLERQRTALDQLYLAEED